MANPILVVEDSAHDLDFTLFALEKCGVSNPVAVVRDGEEALDYLFTRNHYKARTTGNPVLILLDLKMPKADGLEVLKTVRNTPSLAAVPVIVLTHSAVDTDIHHAQLLGVDRYVVKPTDPKQFIGDVCRAVSSFASE